MTDNRVPVWLDCDPGHDDAFAILLAAYHPAIRLLGISTVFGNASLNKTTVNASSILTAIGKHADVAVYPGAAKALARPSLHAPTEIHGETGIDGTALLPRPLVPADASVPAVEAMAAALRAEAPGRAWVVATGALTNVAALFAAHGDLRAHVAGLSAMGGAVGGGFSDAVLGLVDGAPRVGNWTAWAEFNIVIDPEAAAAVLADPVLRRRTTLVPLDVTHQVLATPAVQRLLLHGRAGQAPPDEGAEPAKGRTALRTLLHELLLFFAKTYADVFGITAGPPLHDPLAVAAVLSGVADHEIPFYDYDFRRGAAADLPRERYDVTVVTEGTYDEAHAGAQTGRTVARLLPPGEEGVRIPRGLDIPRFWEVLEECLERADQANTRLDELKQHG